jgi:hypothetical protein
LIAHPFGVAATSPCSAAQTAADATRADNHHRALTGPKIPKLENQMANWSHKARTPLLIIAVAVSMAVVGTLAAGALGATPETPYGRRRLPMT